MSAQRLLKRQIRDERNERLASLVNLSLRSILLRSSSEDSPVPRVPGAAAAAAKVDSSSSSSSDGGNGNEGRGLYQSVAKHLYSLISSYLVRRVALTLTRLRAKEVAETKKRQRMLQLQQLLLSHLRF